MLRRLCGTRVYTEVRAKGGGRGMCSWACKKERWGGVGHRTSTNSQTLVVSGLRPVMKEWRLGEQYAYLRAVKVAVCVCVCVCIVYVSLSLSVCVCVCVCVYYAWMVATGS